MGTAAARSVGLIQTAWSRPMRFWYDQTIRRTRGAAGRHPSARSRARLYALIGGLLSQGAPIGALLLQDALDDRPFFAPLRENLVLYAYMSIATGIAFSAFGYTLGAVADDLLRERRALRKANHRLTWLSEVDTLTGVLNRRAMHAHLLTELKRAERDDSSVALLMLDLDHFKLVNDTFGHVVGDRVLRRVGRRLRRMARATDRVGRVGGEEFLVILPATGIVHARSFAERLRIAIGTQPPNPATPKVTVSVGVLVVARPDPADMEENLREVDAALYRAKTEGRDRVSVSEASRDARPAEPAPV
jgi:diguanylate cyclase (GGDEF)-like protein